MPGMTTVTTTPLQSTFGPIVADAAGTITVQQAMSSIARGFVSASC